MENIIAQIKSIIQGITTVKIVYDYEPKEITQYPAVTINPIGHEDEYLNLRDTKRKYNFMIRVWGELQGTHEDTQKTIRQIADTVIQKLTNQTNISLSTKADFTLLTRGEAKFIQGVSNYYVYEINYSCMVRQNRYTT